MSTATANQIMKWISANQKNCSRIETVLRLLSYMLARKQFSGARHVSELMYSASNLINSLLAEISNPDALYKSLYNNKLFKSLKLTLSALECFEVFFEVSVESTSNELRWLFISVIELVKFAIQLFLLLEPKMFSQQLKSKQHDTMCKDAIETKAEEEGGDGDRSVTGAKSERDVKDQSSSQGILTMPRSKVQIRTIASAAKEKTRTWKAVSITTKEGSANARKEKQKEKSLNGFQVAAEVIYFSRPLLFLATKYFSSADSYKPWFASLSAELSSLLLHDFGLHVRKEEGDGEGSDGEMKELKRRTVLLLLYLLRSPFYENICERNLTTAFLIVTSCIPGSYFLLKPLMDYLPQWQKAYFSVWCR